MTKKDYELIAKAVRSLPDVFDEPNPMMPRVSFRETVASFLADEFVEVHPSFDYSKFCAACRR